MSRRLRLGIVGCGDVSQRHYLGPLLALADRVEIVGVADARPANAERLADAVRATSPDVRSFDGLEAMLSAAHPEAILNLTPATLHAGVTAQALAAGVNVYSEKPMAPTVAEASALIDAARDAGLLLMCAPGSASTRQIRWLRELIDSGKLGVATLATAQTGTMGPAAWPEYTGNPRVFYGPGVGPVFDIGIYRLHDLTTLMGPVKRLAAMGKVYIPRRAILGGPLTGETLDVTTPDHVVMTLEFASGAIGQLVSSFAMADSAVPFLEIHLTGGTISLASDPWTSDGPADIFVTDPRVETGEAATPPDGMVPGWNRGILPPEPDRFPVIGRGAEHFVNCLLGNETPVLTAEHARHVLEIVLSAYRSIETGREIELETTF
jgi:predicted dehydrogenase